ncbi:restriction endonuclease subunit S [Streptococcus mitis]|uniref:restriction endonuclease subunit S n=1 Tax=Streptococcus mitis TaxID=28037 RepID=UPI0020008F4A|nr:restriction endonuclease subunit S [Streptococcus mitis]
MNILEEIQNCSVEWKELGEVVFTLTSPVKLAKKQYQLTGRIPIVDQGEQFIAGYTDNEKYLEKDEYIIFGDHSEHIKFVDFAFVQGADGLKILKPKKGINAKYLYYCVCNFYKKEGNYKRHWSNAKITLIPIPPLKIQEEIVQKLDKMTEYVTELTSELTSRKKQYSYYRDKLLSFEDEVYHVEWKILKDVAKLKNGKDWKAIPNGEIPVYGSGGEMGEFVADYSYDKPTVLIPRKGSISNLFYLEKAFWNVDTIYYTEIDETKLIPKYFYYYLTTVNLEEMSTNPTRPSLTQAILDKIKIPVPSLEIQSRIVQVLDNFDMVCNDLNIGLPKEIELRQKQYEYFREKLLTFVAEGEYTESRVEEWDNSAIIKLLQWVFGPIRAELGSVFEVIAGGDIPKNGISAIETEEYCYPILSNGINEKSLYGWTNQARIKNPSLTVSARGTIGWTSYREKPFFPIVRLLVLTPKINLNLKYAYYFMNSIENNYEIPQSGIPQLTKPMIQSKIITLPPLEKQSSIVSVLDNFNTLTNSLSEGLPKEIELRQKQYEYWRNQLLNFNE